MVAVLTFGRGTATSLALNCRVPVVVGIVGFVATAFLGVCKERAPALATSLVDGA